MNDDLHVPVEQEDFSDADEQEDLSDADEEEEPLVRVRHRPPRKSGGQRHKVLWVTLGVLAALAVVSWMFNQSLGPGAVNTSTPIPTPAPATPIPTVTMHGTPVGPIGGATGTLILLNPGIVRQGAAMGGTGSGFDPTAIIDLAIKHQPTDTRQVLRFVQAAKYGTFYSTLTVPVT